MSLLPSYRRSLIVPLVFFFLFGCTANNTTPSYSTVSQDALRDSDAAQQLNSKGLAHLDAGRLKEAAKVLRAALDQDIYHAPAHNNLGLVLVKQNKYYDAAWEFQYAAKINPRATEPRTNLGLLYEALGRYKLATEQYEHVLDLDPDNLMTMRYLARTYVKTDKDDDDLIQILQKLFAIPGDVQWDSWVRGQLVRIGRHETGRKVLPNHR